MSWINSPTGPVNLNLYSHIKARVGQNHNSHELQTGDDDANSLPEWYYEIVAIPSDAMGGESVVLHNAKDAKGARDYLRWLSTKLVDYSFGSGSEEIYLDPLPSAAD